ncbi:MAG: ribosomal protein S18-alanine N-acetyltransferase [Synechococcales cyanobacterium]
MTDPPLSAEVQPLNLDHLDELLRLDQMGLGGHWSRDSYATELEREHKQVWGILDGQGGVAGFGILWIIVDEAHLVMLVVDPRYRRQGLGRRLVQHLLAIAKEQGCGWALLEVRQSNEAAQQLYRQLGFAVLGVRRHYYQDPIEDALILWKKPLD